MLWVITDLLVPSLIPSRLCSRRASPSWEGRKGQKGVPRSPVQAPAEGHCTDPPAQLLGAVAVTAHKLGSELVMG